MSPALASRRRNDADATLRRLEAYRRYARLVAWQAEALEAGDLDRFQALSQDRELLQESLEAEEPVENGALADPRIADLAARVRLELQRAARTGEALEEGLTRLRDRTAADIRAMEARESSVRRYVTEDEAGAGGARARVNIRL